jgi:hypothetical protein
MSVCYILYNGNGQFKWQELTNYGFYLVDPGHVDEFRSLYPDSRLVPVNSTVI